MRAASLGFMLIVAACAQQPLIRTDLPDSEFQVARYQEAECFERIDDALVPLTEMLKERPSGERGVAEFRVARRGARAFVIDALRWDSGDEGTGFFQERTIVEREGVEGAPWCRTRVLTRPSHSPGG